MKAACGRRCALGGCIGITVLPVPGGGLAGVAAGIQAEWQQQERDAHDPHASEEVRSHALSGRLQLLSAGAAVVGLGCAVAGFFFPPLAVVGAAVLAVSELLFVAAVAIDVVVAVRHPTRDNWVRVGQDAVAVAIGYAVGKVVLGPALRALQKSARQLLEREATEVPVLLPKTGQAADEAIAQEEAASVAAAVKARQAKAEALSRDPQNGQANAKSVSEAATIMQAEEAGLVNNPRRPDLSKGEPNLDFVVDGPPPYKYCDVKTPIEPNGALRNSSAEKQATGIGKSISKQKGGSKNVLHIVDLKNIPKEAKVAFKRTVLESAGSSEGIEFVGE